MIINFQGYNINNKKSLTTFSKTRMAISTIISITRINLTKFNNKTRMDLIAVSKIWTTTTTFLWIDLLLR